jgi:hypothetical protein
VNRRFWYGNQCILRPFTRVAGIVPIIAPRGMVEVNYKITAIRDDGIVESQSADATLIAECAALPERCTSRGTLIGYFDIKA